MPKAKTLEQYLEDISPKLKAKNYTYKGQKGMWQGCRTRIILNCPEHGDWDTATINRVKDGQGCPKCKAKSASQSEEKHIEDILQTGAFPDGASFYTLGERGANWVAIWYYICPVCSEDEYVKNSICSGVFKTNLGALKKGHIPCRCSDRFRYTEDQWNFRAEQACKKLGYTFLNLLGKPGLLAQVVYCCPLHGVKSCVASHFLRGVGCPDCINTNQTELYINIVFDENLPVALKVGISKDSNIRLAQQNSSNALQMKRLFLYKFPSAQECRKAETTIKENFKTCLLSVLELKDGHTETFDIQYLPDIISFLEECNCQKFEEV